MDDLLEQNIICPITMEIMYNPVIASDGKIYEHDAIKRWLKENDRSPITNETLEPKVYKNPLLKMMIDKYLEQYPHLKDKQYRIQNTYFDNIKKINKYINKKNYTELLNYNEYNIEKLIADVGIDFFLKMPFRIQKHIIDNCTDLEYISDNGIRLIHVFCGYGKPDIIKHIVDKCKDINCINQYVRTPLMYLCLNTNVNDDILYYLINKGADIQLANDDGEKAIHLVCQNNKISFDIIKLMINKGVNINSCTNNGFRPIHYLCKQKYFTVENLKFMLNNGADIKCIDIYGKRPIHYISEYGSPETIKFFIDYCCSNKEHLDNLECADKYGLKPIHYIFKYSTLTVLHYLISKGVTITDVPEYVADHEQIEMNLEYKYTCDNSKYNAELTGESSDEEDESHTIEEAEE